MQSRVETVRVRDLNDSRIHYYNYPPYNSNHSNNNLTINQAHAIDYPGQHQQPPYYHVRPTESLSSVSSSIRRLVEQSDPDSAVDDFPLKFVMVQASLFILTNVAIIIVQIGMSLINAVFSSIGIGYWVRGFEILFSGFDFEFIRTLSFKKSQTKFLKLLNLVCFYHFFLLKIIIFINYMIFKITIFRINLYLFRFTLNN